MFSFVKQRKAENVVGTLASSTPEAVDKASSIERAAALVLTNVLMFVGAKSWGRQLIERPAALPRNTAIDAVCLLADEHARLESAADTLDGRPVTDPAIMAYRWELLANEVVTLTVGSGFSADAAQAMRQCWKSLWSARRSCDDAVRAMMFYAKSYSIEPTPRIDGLVPSADFLRKMGRTLPPTFRRKKVVSS